MTKKNILYILPLLAAILFFGCEAEIDKYTPDAGELDLTTYVAVGNSLTAGFADGELYRSMQENSLGNIIAGQLMHTGLESFRQPLMKDDLGLGNRLVLGIEGGELTPIPAPGEHDSENEDNIFETEGPFHNMGVPGARAIHLAVPGYGTMNPYFGRFASNPAQTSILSDAVALDPTFFSLWIGSNDILGYALGGGEGDGITPTDDFRNSLHAILGELTKNDAKGVIGNIPVITDIPYFQTIPYNALILNTPEEVDALNAGYAEAPHINFEMGPNPFVVVDNDHPAGVRQLEEGELIRLPALPHITGAGWGSQLPMPAEYYLSLDQIDHIHGAIESFNDIIQEAANTNGLAFADIKTLMKSAKTGIYFDALAFNMEFVTGGVFSLDGIHLSARGNALAANEFIAAINNTYNASIPKATVGNFNGIIFP